MPRPLGLRHRTTLAGDVDCFEDVVCICSPKAILSHALFARRRHAGLKLSRNGGFIGCSAYPECKFVRPLQMYGGDDQAETGGLAFPHVLGADPETGLEVALKLGPYGTVLSFFLRQRELATFDGVGFGCRERGAGWCFTDEATSCGCCLQGHTCSAATRRRTRR